MSIVECVLLRAQKERERDAHTRTYARNPFNRLILRLDISY